MRPTLKESLDRADVFLVSSNDSGKTFSNNPVKVNDIDGDAYISDYAIPVRLIQRIKEYMCFGRM